MKKYLIAALIIVSMNLMAGDIDDIKYINKLYQNKYYDETILELKSFIQKYPKSKLYDSAQNLLAYNYYITNDLKKSKDTYKKLINSEFKDSVYYYLEMIALKEKSLDEAEEYVLNIPNESSLRKRGVYFLAEYFYDKNILDKAERYFKIMMSFDGELTTKSLLKLGVIYYKKSEYIKSSAILKEYLSKNDEDESNLALVYYILANSNDKTEEFDEAIKNYEIIENNFDKSNYYTKSLYSLMRIYSNLKNYIKLEEYAIKLKGTGYEKRALEFWGDIEYSRKEYNKSEEIYSEILEKDQDQEVLYKLILSYIKNKKYDEVLNKIDGLKDSNYTSEYYYYTAFILNEKKEYKLIYKKLKDMDDLKIKDEHKKNIFLIMAKSLFNEKNYDEAINYYNRLYSLTNDIKYLYNVILISKTSNNTKELERTLKIYKEKHSDDKKYKKDIYTLVGNYFIEKKIYSKAEINYKEFLKMENDQKILNNLVSILINTGKYDEVLKYTKANDTDEKFLRYRALAYFGLGDFEKSAIILKDLINSKDVEKQEESYIKLIDCYISLKQYNQVVIYGSQYENKGYKSELTNVRLKKGIAYFRLKEFESAIREYNKISKVKKYEDYAAFMKAEIYFSKKDYENAKKYYTFVAYNENKSKYQRSSLYSLITLNYQEEKFDESLKHINYFLEEFDNGEYLEDIISYLGNIYFMKNKTDLAIKEYEKLFEMTKNSKVKLRVNNILVETFYQEEKFDKALIWTEKLENNSNKLLWKARILEKQENNEETVKLYMEILDDKEKGDQANYYLGLYYLNKNKNEEARNYFKNVEKFSSSEFKDDAIYQMGISFEKEGKYQQANTYFLRIKILYESSNLYEISYIRIAENYEKLSDEFLNKKENLKAEDKKKDAINIYKEFAEKFKNSEYYSLVIERLLVTYLNDKNIKEAELYYNEFKKTNPEESKNYTKFFNDGGVKGE